MKLWKLVLDALLHGISETSEALREALAYGEQPETVEDLLVLGEGVVDEETGEIIESVEGEEEPESMRFGVLGNNLVAIIEDEALEHLIELGEITGSRPVEVVSRALAVLDLHMQAKIRGDKVIFVSRDGKDFDFDI